VKVERNAKQKCNFVFIPEAHPKFVITNLPFFMLRVRVFALSLLFIFYFLFFFLFRGVQGGIFLFCFFFFVFLSLFFITQLSIGYVCVYD